MIQWKDVKPNDAPKDSEILTKLLLCDFVTQEIFLLVFNLWSGPKVTFPISCENEISKYDKSRST